MAAQEAAEISFQLHIFMAFFFVSALRVFARASVPANRTPPDHAYPRPVPTVVIRPNSLI